MAGAPRCGIMIRPITAGRQLVVGFDGPEHVSMRTRRFKVEDLSGPVIRVGGSEAGHGLRVLRLGVGAEVVLFDGRGGEVSGRICSVGRSQFEVQVTSRGEADREHGPEIHLAVAAPKGGRADTLVEKCAELGVRGLHLLRTDRGEVLPGETKLGRWRRKAVEAAKQAGHRTTMAIEDPRGIDEIAAAAGKGRIFYGDPACAARTLHEALGEARGEDHRQVGVLIFIGPEGGFTERECAAIEELGGRPVRLCDAILRVETAAIAAAAIVAGAAATHHRE